MLNFPAGRIAPLCKTAPRLGRRALTVTALLLASATLAGAKRTSVEPHVLGPPPGFTPCAAWVSPDAVRFERSGPETVPMRPTQSAPGSRGSLTLTQPSSPFGIRVDADGTQAYRISVQVERLRKRPGATYVAWVAKPELDEYVRLGTLGDSNRVEGSVVWNQFLVFVSEEADANAETWAGAIVLTGISPSSRLHTMAGHGPFDDVSCSDFY